MIRKYSIVFLLKNPIGHFNFITMSKSIIFTIGSRPTMADKILRRTSYGGEQTDSLGKYIEIQATVLCTGSVTDLTHNTKLST